MKKTYKQRTLNIKFSTSFITRTRCKYCLDFSQFAYKVRNSPTNKDFKISIQKFEYIRNNMKRMCDDYYLDFNPKVFLSNSLFTHDLSYKGYNPRFHRLRDADKNINCTEFISCECGMTSWAFNYMFCNNQPASNRRTDKSYKEKFIF